MVPAGGLAVMSEPLTDAERAQLRELLGRQIRQGQDQARAEGRRVGRPPKLDDADRAEIRQLKDAGVSVADIAKRYPGVAVRTIYDALRPPATE